MKEFTKADLQNRMVVEYRNGERRMVIDDVLIGIHTWDALSQYDDSLKRTGCNKDYRYVDYDIVKLFPKVYRFSEMCSLSEDDVIWERSDIAEVTMTEVEEKFGYKVKIVKE